MSIYLENAAAIADQLCEDAHVANGRANWVSRSVPYAQRRPDGKSPDLLPALEPLNPSFYSGTAGIAVFLARLHQYTKDPRHARMAKAAIRHSIEHAFDVVPASERPMPIGTSWQKGFYIGSMGIAWATEEVGRALGSDDIRREGRSLFARVASEPSATEFDLMFGVAGSVAASLSLAEQGYQGAQEFAVAMGDWLLSNARKEEQGWSWLGYGSSPNAPALLGLSHGTSGVAVVMQRLYEATKDERYLEAVEQSIAYERAKFDAQEGNWPHFGIPAQQDGRPGFFSTWCHGAPGVGLARAFLYPRMRDARMLDEIRDAWKNTVRSVELDLERPGRDFQYCHGVGGNTECLWEMASVLDPAKGAKLARDVAQYGVERYGKGAAGKWGGWAGWPTAVSHRYHPPLITGLAGVGYFLLRVHDPARVPTVLLPAVSMDYAAAR